MATGDAARREKQVDQQQVAMMKQMMAKGGDRAVEKRFGPEVKASPEYQAAQKQQRDARRLAARQREQAMAEAQRAQARKQPGKAQQGAATQQGHRAAAQQAQKPAQAQQGPDQARAQSRKERMRADLAKQREREREQGREGASR